MTGFTIRGKVMSYTNAMPNVNVYLYKAAANINTENDKNAFKSEESDIEGDYVF